MDPKCNPLELDFSTLAVHGGHSPDDWPHKPISEPFVASSTFKQDAPGEFEKFNFSRAGNPNRSSLEKRLAILENAKFGAAFPSGVSVAFAIGSLFRPGDHFVISNDLYGGTLECFVNLAKDRDIQIDYVDLVKNLSDLKQHLRKDTKLLWFETPTNPTLEVIDIKAVCDLAKSIAKEIVIVVDNTFLTPYFQRPLELGATVSMYSLTKYLNGHSDIVMGAAVTNSADIYAGLRKMQTMNGICPSPFDCYQVTRGSKTLALRMQQHDKNALKIAKFLEKSAFVTKVNHTGLESHPNYEITQRQTSGNCGIMSFTIRGGIEEVKKFLAQLKVIQLAGSVGGVETLVASPALMTHDTISQEERDKMGISDTLIRLTVGIENADDLIRDLEQALKAVYK